MNPIGPTHGVIDGIYRLSQSDFHEPVTIGNRREMAIKQFAQEIIRITGSKSGIEYKPLPVDEPKVRQLDIGRAKKISAGNRRWNSRKESCGRSTIFDNGTSASQRWGGGPPVRRR
jgi:hypothetical protein